MPSARSLHSPFWVTLLDVILISVNLININGDCVNRVTLPAIFPNCLYMNNGILRQPVHDSSIAGNSHSYCCFPQCYKYIYQKQLKTFRNPLNVKVGQMLIWSQGYLATFTPYFFFFYSEEIQPHQSCKSYIELFMKQSIQ